MLRKVKRLLPYLESVELRTTARPLFLSFEPKDPLGSTARSYFLRRFDLPFTKTQDRPLWVHPIESKEQATFKILSETAPVFQSETLRPGLYLAIAHEQFCFVLNPIATSAPLPFLLLAEVGTLQNPALMQETEEAFSGDFQILSANSGKARYVYNLLIGLFLFNLLSFWMRIFGNRERTVVVANPAVRQLFEEFKDKKAPGPG